MGAAKLAISLDPEILKKIDRLVKKGLFPNRSKAIQAALEDKINRIDRVRLAQECAKLDKQFEREIAEEDLSEDELKKWPRY